MPKKTNLDPSNLLEEDPQFAKFVRIFCRYFYGRKWLEGQPQTDASSCIGFPTSLEPKDATIPPAQLAKMFRRYCFEPETNPNPEVLMQHLDISSQFRSSLGFLDRFDGPSTQEKVLEALKQHLHRSFCASLEEYRIHEGKRNAIKTAEQPDAGFLSFLRSKATFTIKEVAEKIYKLDESTLRKLVEPDGPLQYAKGTKRLTAKSIADHLDVSLDIN